MAARPARAPAPPAAHQELSPADGLAQLSFLIQGILERRAREHDLSVIQIRLLGVLRDRTPTMNELARLLGLDKSSITGLVDRAERRGLVTRVPSTADRRAVLVSLTDHGRSLAAAGAARFEADIRLLLGHLPPSDRDALSRLVSRLLVAHATDQGIDLFATIRSENPQAETGELLTDFATRYGAFRDTAPLPESADERPDSPLQGAGSNPTPSCSRR